MITRLPDRYCEWLGEPADLRASAGRGNLVLTTTIEALRRFRLCPRRIGAIVAAAFLLLHHEHGRTA